MVLCLAAEEAADDWATDRWFPPGGRHGGRAHARLPPGRLHGPVLSPGPSSARWRPAAAPGRDSRASRSSGGFCRPFRGGHGLTVLLRLSPAPVAFSRRAPREVPSVRAPPADSFEALALDLLAGAPVLCTQPCRSLCSAERAPPPTAPSRCSAGKGRELGASCLTPITRTFPPPRLPSRCPRCQCPHGFNLPPPACSVQREHSLAAPPSSALWPSVLFRLASSDMSSVATTFPASVNANPSGPALCSLPRCQPAHVTVKAILSPRSSSSTPPHQYSPTVGATAAHLGDSHALALLLPVGAPPFSRVPPHRSRCCPRPGCAH